MNMNQSSLVQTSPHFLNTISQPQQQQQQQPSVNFNTISKVNSIKSKDSNLNENLISSTSNTNSPRNSTNSRLNSYDWSVNDDENENDDDDDLDEMDEYNDSIRNLSTDELKLQPSIKKSKKKNDFMNDYSCINNDRNSLFFNSELIMSDTEFSDTDDVTSTLTKGNRRHQFVPNELKDDKYWARRRKNNMAAKRSRDARRMKENQIAITASYLERENDLLRKQLEDSKRETKLLKAKLARYESMIPMDSSAK